MTRILRAAALAALAALSTVGQCTPVLCTEALGTCDTGSVGRPGPVVTP